MISRLGFLALAIAAFTGSADASDIKVMSANVFTHVIEEIAKDFTSATGHKIASRKARSPTSSFSPVFRWIACSRTAGSRPTAFSTSPVPA
jgi:hypothetical protein